MKILVCDDEELMRKAIAFELKQAGHNVITASDGFEAINQITSHSPDVILLDIAMPYLSGFELLNYLKSTFSNMAVLLVSALDNKDVISTAMKLGADAFITKPFKNGELLIKMQEVVERKKIHPSHVNGHDKKR